MSPGVRPPWSAILRGARERMQHELDAIGLAAIRGSGIRLRCAVCNRPVDEVIREQEPGGFTRHLIARCHGAEDRMTITLHAMQNWTAEEIAFWQAVEAGKVEGVAFGHAAIEGAG